MKQILIVDDGKASCELLAGIFVVQARKSEESKREAGAEKAQAVPAAAGIIGRTPAMISIYKEIARVAPSRSTVMITGESGTGKELIARSIHKHSPRAEHPFIAV